MMIKRLFSTEFTKGLFSEILRDNSGTILAVGVIGSGTFGIGLYVNQMRIYEEKINSLRMEAKKDIAIAEEKINSVRMEAKKDSVIAEERANKEGLKLLYNIFTQEEYKESKKKMLDQRSKNE